LYDGSGSTVERPDTSVIRSGNVESQGVKTTETAEEDQHQTTMYLRCI
jgi:hypothetical protein